MAHRNFDQERVDRWQDGGLISFEIGGESFIIRPVVDPALIAEWDDAPQTMGNREAAELCDRMMQGLIIPGQADRWTAARERRLDDLIGPDSTHQEVIEASRKCIDLPALMEVMPWLIEQVTGRPFQLPDASTGSPDTSGTGSTDAAPSPESTPMPSTSAAS